MSFPSQQQAAARAAFGRFNPDQALQIFDRTVGSGHPSGVIEVAPRTWWIQPGMVNVCLFETDAGLVLVDAGCAGDGPELLRVVRSLSDQPLRAVVYTHGHCDHAFGLWAFLEAGETPEIYAHRNLPAHFDRYLKTAGLNARINGQRAGVDGTRWLEDPATAAWPTQTYDDVLEIEVGGEQFVLHHGMGETDDATWVWAPERRVIAAGDLVTGYLPNAGNPRKVQRYAEEWADAADQMANLDPVAIVTGHGEPVVGTDAIRDELGALARYLRVIVDHALAGLNAGVLPDHIVESLVIPLELRDHPRLPALYDQPEFICRNVIRRYSGWWDGYPSHLLPAPQETQAREIARLAGGTAALVARANELTATDPRLAGHLAEWAFLADREDPDAQECYRRVFEDRALRSPGLMAQVNLRVSARWVDGS
ncbi:MBL fold metallo-hydrolase [Nocardioides sp. WV_118_6]|uniref:MBL fold metallo-hydrolase n=1 Tax=Nocardioides simplex TaxID=2045 RepID=UPI00214FA463|nr:MBL fold metallo-hydrolase [Pimelobacter simplex]UUW89249.1 MBL fold metallo-hydrolase [Pimelobacter simplex]UUW93077.1 MBL fold metallo-hydrolase [Pimelobacter simplex]